MNTTEIRRLFVDFFAERGHRHVPSSSLIPPPEEKTLLFSNAGMNQMKPYFMGMSDPPSRRMTSIQKCFRTSDIEEVGDSSHCTFFEMLGNFSVGDYFKAEVIPWAWELLTEPAPKGMGLSKDKLWTTVYLDDDEAHDLWLSCGIPEERIVRFDESENYWFMIKGGAGPCGPNSEIYYDFGPEIGCGQADCSPPTHDCGRFLEIWNLVFMALYQEEDGKTRRPLPQKNVDTGGGLERFTTVDMWQNGVDWQGNPKQWERPPSIYDTDLFRRIISVIQDLCGLDYDEVDEGVQRSFRIVAEHVRAATFLIADGVAVSTEGRGDVLRRLIRRAVVAMEDLIIASGHGPTSVSSVASAEAEIRSHRQAYELRRERWDSGQAFLARVADEVISLFRAAYPEVGEQQQRIVFLLHQQDSSSRKSITEGLDHLNHMLVVRRFTDEFRNRHLDDRDSQAVGRDLEGLLADQGLARSIREATLQPILEASSNGTIWDFPIRHLSGAELFLLEATYGLDLSSVKERAEGFSLDEDALVVLRNEQRQRSRAATRFEGDSERIQTYAELGLQHTEFVGYDTTRAFASVVSILLDGNTIVRELTPQLGEGHRVEITLDHTPFYAEGGGQVGDRGEVHWPGGRFVVEDTQHVGEGGVVAHLGRIEAGTLTVGDPVEAVVDDSLRGDTMRNHTGTHILHAALRKVLGTHVRQAGSLVTPDRLRFDFTHLEALSPEQLREVETMANRVVRENLTVHIENKSYEEALADGALAFFGDKYADVVRVVGVCDVELHDCFSHELCGGTHVHASGEVGSIIVTGETSIGAGLRRIEAVTGRAAAERARQDEEILGRLGASLMAPAGEIEGRIAAMRDENDRLRKQLQTMERRLARGEAEEVAGSATQIGGVSVVVTSVADAPSADALRDMGDGLRQKLGDSIVLLGAVIDGKPMYLAMATPDASKRCGAGDIVRVAAKEAGGGGGGRPELAQGGGTDPSKLEAGLAAGRKLIEEKLGG